MIDKYIVVNVYIHCKDGEVIETPYKSCKQILLEINSNITPESAPIKYKSPKIIKFSFLFLFVLNKTRSAIPAPDRRPASKAENDIALFKNNSVRTTLPAQLGINHIKLVIKEPKILSFQSISFR